MARKVAYGAGREVLIAATVDVVAARGLRGMTFRAVAEQAQVNNSLVAHHFGTREALLSAALDWAVEQSIQATRLLDMSTEQDFADAFLISISEHPELQAFQYEMILEARRNQVFSGPVERLYSRYQIVAEQSLRSLGIHLNVSATARWMFAALDGIVLQSMAGVPESTLRQAIHEMWAVLALPAIQESAS